MAALRVINLSVRFLLELATLVAAGYWGATFPGGRVARVSLAILLPIVIAILWGLFISPKARFSMGRAGQSGLGLIVFLGGAAAIFDRGHASLATAFALVAIVSSALLFALPQQASRGDTDAEGERVGGQGSEVHRL